MVGYIYHVRRYGFALSIYLDTPPVVQISCPKTHRELFWEALSKELETLQRDGVTATLRRVAVKPKEQEA